MASEMILEAREQYLTAKALERLNEACKNGEPLTPEKLEEINRLNQRDLESEIDRAQLGTSIVAALLNQDVNIAATVGLTAAEHNFEPTIGSIVGGALLAWGVYEVIDIYRTQGLDKAMEHLVVMGVVTVATAGAGAVVYKIGAKAYPSAQLAWNALLTNYPKYGELIGKITGSKAATTLAKVKEAYSDANKALARAFGGGARTEVGASVSAPGFKSSSGKISETPISWTAPTGTGQTYKVWQRTDIDWNMVRTTGEQRFIGKTNAEAARAGLAPQLPDGRTATLHHIGQNSQGPLVEATTRLHDLKNPKAFRALHNQFKRGTKHPEYPVDHGVFGKESAEYWKARVAE